MNKNIAVVGCGYWGRNLVPNFAGLSVLHTVCDSGKKILGKSYLEKFLTNITF